MEEIKTIKDLLEKIRTKNSAIFNLCPEEKILQDTDYGYLYQAFWMADFRLKNVIGLLEVVEKNMSSEQNK